MTIEKKLRWIAIGDSFTYLNDHPDETGYRVTKGYLERVRERLPELDLINIGINGSTTETWLAVNLPRADVYTILLGTNDWHQGILVGSMEDFLEAEPGTILGNLGVMVKRIRHGSPEAKILVMTPVERGDFVYIGDPHNHAKGSYLPEKGVFLQEVSKAIREACEAAEIPCLDLHEEAGFRPDNVVRFKRVHTEEGDQDLAWPAYAAYNFNPDTDPYPYPPKAADMTYDGLHPSDKGNEAIARLISEQLKILLDAHEND